MTSAEAQRELVELAAYALRVGLCGVVIDEDKLRELVSLATRARDALAAWEAEDAARRGMPEVLEPWRVIDRAGDEWASYTDKAEAMSRAKRIVEVNDHRGPFRAVRLAVVEVAEPEPEPEPEKREVQPSGFWYRRADKSWCRAVEAMVGDLVAFTVSPTDLRFIPPADRALVARLLGEVG